MRTPLLMLLTAVVAVSGCTSVDTMTRTQRRPILDEYASLDDQGRTRPSDQVLQRRLEEARRHYLYAMRASEQGKDQLAGRHFEASLAILNDLVTYPDIYANPEFTRLSESVIQDYESRITSTDDLDPNSSFFVLRDKIYQEIETIPVERKHYPSRRQLATINEGGGSWEMQIEMTDNTPVQQCISYFTSEKGRRFFGNWLRRTGRYFPMYDRILAEEGVPREIRHLSMIESGLTPTAVSWAKAVGLWQFIPSTGIAYGLRIDWWVDERRDPEKATRAAARYLKDLYTDLGDWHLALAAYNCGPGRVRSAIAKANSRNFWDIRPYLPRETRDYVPLFIAATRITMEPETFGFTNIEYETPDDVKQVPVRGSYDLATIARVSNTTVDELKRLNPELLRERTPNAPSTSYGYPLRVPYGAPDDIAAAITALPEGSVPNVAFVDHKVGRGETLTSIAARYNVSVEDLSDANDLSPTAQVRRGARLKVPVRSGEGSTSSTALASNDAGDDETADKSETPEPVAAQPRRDETLLASNERTATPPVAATARRATPPTARASQGAAPASSDEQQAWVDALSRGSGGAQAVSEPVAETGSARRAESRRTTPREERSTTRSRRETTSTVHVVDRGETLIGIAREYKVDVADLAEWNGIDRNTNVRIGQKLRVNGVAASRSNDNRQVAARESASSRRRTTTSSRYESHRVRRGETLTEIADRYGVSIDDLRSWNERSLGRSGQLQAGATLKIYGEAPSKGDARRTSRNSKSAPKSYKVRRGDTLEEIADRFGVSVRQIRSSNPKLSNRNLQAGQTIRIQ